MPQPAHVLQAHFKVLALVVDRIPFCILVKLWLGDAIHHSCCHLSATRDREHWYTD